MMATTLAALLLAAAPIGRAELAELGRRIAADFAAGQDGLTSHLDVEALVARALAGVPATPEMAQGITAGALKSGLPTGPMLLREVQAGGTITYRSLGRIGEEDVIRLRLISAGGAFNYIELFTARDAGGAVRVVDAFTLADGARISENMHRLLFMAVAEAQQGLLDRLAGADRVYLENLSTLKRMAAAHAAGRPAEALELYDALPRALREEPALWRQAVFAAADVDEARYRRSMAGYMRAHPRDPAADMMAVDASFLRKDWQGARRALDRIERYVGTDDGWVEMLRGSVATAAGEEAVARRHFEGAARREPALRQAHGALLDLALKARDWPAVARALRGLEQAGQPLADLTQVEGFEAFLASREGKAFLRERRAGRR